MLNDCVTRLRHRLRNCVHADRLDVHNADYGFARNFAGLRPLWMTFLVLSAAGCWIGFMWFHSAFIWAGAASVLVVVGFLVSLGQERYVRVRARHYTDSFFSAVLELDEAEHNPKPHRRRSRRSLQRRRRRTRMRSSPNKLREMTDSHDAATQAEGELSRFGTSCDAPSLRLRRRLS